MRDSSKTLMTRRRFAGLAAGAALAPAGAALGQARPSGYDSNGFPVIDQIGRAHV